MANRERWKRFEELPDDVRDRLERLPELLARRSVLLAYVFGSLAENETPPDPPEDVDLALLVEGEPVHALRTDLEGALGTRRLDLVDLRRASPVLRFHVIRDGHLLYARDDEVLNRFELDTLHVYRDTAPLRRRHRRMLRERMDTWS